MRKCACVCEYRSMQMAGSGYQSTVSRSLFSFASLLDVGMKTGCQAYLEVPLCVNLSCLLRIESLTFPLITFEGKLRMCS